MSTLKASALPPGALVGAGDGMGGFDIVTDVSQSLKIGHFAGGSVVLPADELNRFLVGVWIEDLGVSAFFASSTAAVLGWGRLSLMALIRLIHWVRLHSLAISLSYRAERASAGFTWVLKQDKSSSSLR